MIANLRRKYQKALATLQYIAGKEERLYWTLKMIWRADNNHLSRHGRMITNDKYIAMRRGPVPSMIYDIVKDTRGEGWYSFENPYPIEIFETPNKRTIKHKAKANSYESLLSETDKECLDEAYEELSPLSFEEVKTLSHTPAYKNSDEDDEILLEELVKDLENGQEVWDYLVSI